MLKIVSKVSFDDMYEYVMADAKKAKRSALERQEHAENHIQQTTLMDPFLKKKKNKVGNKKKMANENLIKGIDEVDARDEEHELQELEQIKLKKDKEEEGQNYLLAEERQILQDEDTQEEKNKKKEQNQKQKKNKNKQ